MTSKQPNFFIIGAPKCGTSSLAHWLGQHPQVYFSPVKEPHFYNTDHRDPWRPTESEYAELFAGADGHRAVGEGSVWYLASDRAVSNILAVNPDARFIVCLRNPVEMAPSLHHQVLFTGIETIPDFREAWAAQERRARGEAIPREADEPAFLRYGPMCKLGEQLRRLYERVPRERVHLVFLEDMAKDPHSAYRGVTDFLGLDPVPQDLRRVNEATARRSRLLTYATRKLYRLKRRAGFKASLGIGTRVERWNRTQTEWQRDDDFADVLRDYFRDDIALLSELTGRDLSGWLVPAASRLPATRVAARPH